MRAAGLLRSGFERDGAGPGAPARYCRPAPEVGLAPMAGREAPCKSHRQPQGKEFNHAIDQRQIARRNQSQRQDACPRIRPQRVDRHQSSDKPEEGGQAGGRHRARYGAEGGRHSHTQIQIMTMSKRTSQRRVSGPGIEDPPPTPPGDPRPGPGEHDRPSPSPIELPPEPNSPHPSQDPIDLPTEPRFPPPRRAAPERAAKVGALGNGSRNARAAAPPLR